MLIDYYSSVSYESDVIRIHWEVFVKENGVVCICIFSLLLRITGIFGSLASLDINVIIITNDHLIETNENEE